MFVGHYSTAFLAKRVEPRVPLWLLFVAAQLVDVFWDVLVLLGIDVALTPFLLPPRPSVGERLLPRSTPRGGSRPPGGRRDRTSRHPPRR